MRAALAGVPIVSPTWISQCINQKSLKPPEDSMYIQTLPTKEEMYMVAGTENSKRSGTAHGGIFAIAAQYKDTQIAYRLFNNFYVYLCGAGWKKSSPKTKDVQLLLKEGGGNVLNSASVVAKTLTNGLEIGSSFVLLCDGTISAGSAFTKNLKQAIENSIDDGTSVLVVDSKWLFDCISCAEILGAKHYQPLSATVKPLWQKSMKK